MRSFARFVVCSVLVLVLLPGSAMALSGPPLITGPDEINSHGGLGNASLVTFTLPGDATSALCALDGEPFVACASPWTFPQAHLEQGSHSVVVRAVGATPDDTAEASATFDIDHEPPTFEFLRPTEGEVVPPSLAELSFRAHGYFNPPLGYKLLGCDTSASLLPARCGFGQGPFTHGSGDETEQRIKIVNGFAPGNHSLTVFATDQAGNRGEQTIRFTVSGYPWPASTFNSLRSERSKPRRGKYRTTVSALVTPPARMGVSACKGDVAVRLKSSNRRTKSRLLAARLKPKGVNCKLSVSAKLPIGFRGKRLHVRADLPSSPNQAGFRINGSIRRG